MNDMMRLGVTMWVTATVAGCENRTGPPNATPAEITPLEIIALHEPMHPGDNAPVTFRAVATARKIILRYERLSLTASDDGMVSQSVVEPLSTLTTCEGSGDSPITCVHEVAQGFPQASLIRFEAVAEGEAGAIGSESYFFAAGTYPVSSAAVPIRLKTSTSAGLDMVFIGTSDLSPEDLRASLHSVVYGIYFEYEALRNARGVYNYYYSRQRGGYSEGCRFSNPSNMATLEATGDAVVFLHRATMRDCKVGKRISSEVSNEKSLIHETGHVLFDLQDEYCCDSSYRAQQCVPNLWTSRQGCQDAAPGLDYDELACAQLATGHESLAFWRIDPDGDGGCIMGPGQHTPGSGFRTACRRRVAWRHQKCLAGTCFTTPACP